MFCGQCGSEVNDNARFCPSCGSRLDQQTQAPSNPPAEDIAGPMTLPDSGQAAAQGYEVHTPPPGHIPYIKNYLVESILCVIFCCRPFAIVGIVFAAQVDKFIKVGLIDMAKDASQKAKKWTLISFIVGLVLNLIVIAVYGTTIYAALNEGIWY